MVEMAKTARLVLLARKVRRAKLARKVLKVRPALQVLKVCPALSAFQGRKAHRGFKGCQALSGRKAQPAQWVPRGRKVLKAWMAVTVPSVLLDHKVLKVYQVRSDLWGLKARQV
jgi:hypothetical protein